MVSNAWFSGRPGHGARDCARGSAACGAGPALRRACRPIPRRLRCLGGGLRDRPGGEPRPPFWERAGSTRIDAALAAPGLLAAENIHRAPLAAVAPGPAARPARRVRARAPARLESMLELSSAYRGTALVLGDVIEADDGYTGEHCKSVVALTLELAEHLGLERRAPAQPRVRRAAARRRQDRDPQGDHQQARQARPPRVDDHQDPHRSRARRCSSASAASCARSASSSAPTTSAGTAAATPTASPASRSRSRRGSSPAATPGTRCAPTVPTARRSPTTSRSPSCSRTPAPSSTRRSSRP